MKTGRSSRETLTIHDVIAGVRAVPAFNFYTFRQLQGIAAAAGQSQAPTLGQVSKRSWGLGETELERAVTVGFVRFNFATGVDTAEQDAHDELRLCRLS